MRGSTSTLSRCHDVTVIGGGPVGCVTAIAHAEQGAKVLLLEARSAAPTRFAGEWLHPPGAEVLSRLGIEAPASTQHIPSGKGFVVFPDDGSFPIVLDYPNAARGLSAEHGDIVTALWDSARARKLIEFVPSARVTFLEDKALCVERPGHPGTQRLLSDRIVGADGRSSVTRKTLGYPQDRQLLSYMAGLLLEDVELPFEGYGHVLLGGPGPALIYRIGARRARVCLDVPVYHLKVGQRASYLWDAYSPVLPVSLRPAFHKALRERPIAWAANQMKPRRHFGRDATALVGDAVGHYHPLTAVGMTLGFLDGECLASTPSVAEYSATRLRQGRVPELLANALYEVLSFYDDETVAVRQAVYQLWRDSAPERKRTMRLLSSGDTELGSFSMAFGKVLLRATGEIMARGSQGRQLRHQLDVLGHLGQRLGWLAAQALPETVPWPRGPSRFGELWQSFQFHRRRRPSSPRSLRDRKPSKAPGPDASVATQRGATRLVALQSDEGAWNGEVVWCPMLAAQYALTHELLGRPLPEGHREALLRGFASSQLESGCWGLHAHSEPYLFTSVLVYVAARHLGVDADDELLRRAGDFIASQGGAVRIPTWGKFWLAMLGLYSWKGVNPLLPEVWALPKWFPLHPSNFYCHTRLIYTAMAYIYGQKFQRPLDGTSEALRRELFPQGYENVNFGRAAGSLRSEEVYAPPSPLLKAGYFACRVLDKLHLPGARTRLLTGLLEQVRFDVRSTHYRSLSPVNGLLNIICLALDNPMDAELEKCFAGLDSWVWQDAEGLRVAGARSDVWDTSFALQALQALPEAESEALVRGRAWLLQQQVARSVPGIERYHRQDPRGGFGFSPAWHGWPVSDCTAEAIHALLHDVQTPRAALLDAARFILSCQNSDGGFGSYERRKSRWGLEWINPAEMFGNSMTEKSYTECTASSLSALAAFRARHPGLLDGSLNPAVERATLFLRNLQRPEGDWPAAWGIGTIYGTLFGIRGLLAGGHAPTEPAIRKACTWLIERQRSDGGWGEHWKGSLRGDYLEHTKSQVVQTAWALIALLEARSPEWDPIKRAAQFLVDAQLEDGDWPRQDGGGMFFNTAVLDYTLYKTVFPVWALGLYERRRRERSQLDV